MVLYIKASLLLLAALLFLGVHSHLDICMPLNQAYSRGDEEVFVNDLVNRITENSNDTIHFDHLDFNFTHPAISANGSLDNVTISNILDISMVYNVSSDAMNATISLNNLYMEGQYDLFGNIGDLFDIFGKGDFWLNTTVNVVVVFNVLMTDVICIPLDLYLELPTIEGYFHHFMDDPELEELLNKAMIYLAPKMVVEFLSEFKDAYDDDLQEYINCYFNYNCNNSTTTIATNG